ncbi:MAG: zinc ribbon domain-containing protein [Calditrichaceae bacterium]
MKLDEQIAMKFACPRCKTSGAAVKRIAATGSGLSKFLDIQHNTFIAASCKNCGYTELYNPEFLEGKSTLSDIVDFIFGG